MAETYEKSGFWARVQDQLALILFLILSVSFLFFFYFYDRIVITIPAGHGGVLFQRLFGGTVTDRVYSEGIRLIFPWDNMILYDARLQEEKQEVRVLSQNGLIITLTVSVRYRPIYDEMGMLHQTVGPDYLRKIIHPVTIASVREVIGKYRPEDLYTTRREEIQDEMIIEVIEKNGEHPILFEDIIIRSLMLPPLINEAIEKKLKEEQAFLEYEFRVQREAEEAKRKLIEARGWERFQSIIAQSLTDKYLQWQGIQATLKLAESPNAKIVVIGSGKDGLPIILNTETYPPLKEIAPPLPEIASDEEENPEASIAVSPELIEIGTEQPLETPTDQVPTIVSPSEEKSNAAKTP